MLSSWRVVLVLLGLFLLAWLLQSGLVAFAGYVVVGVYLLSRFLAQRWMDNLEVTREAELPPLEVGDSATVTLRYHNRGTIPLGWALVEELLPRFAMSRQQIRVSGPRLQILHLRPGQTKSVRLKLTFLSRGYFALGPTLAETGDVFGLHRRHKVLGRPIYAMVLPKIVPLPDYDFASERPIGEVRLAHLLFEDPTRTAGVRPYQRGDPLQRVHWRATARTGELHSRIYEPTSLAGATIAIDFHRSGYFKRGEPFRSELTITTACAIAHQLVSMNQPVGLVSNGRDAAERIRLEEVDAKPPANAQSNAPGEPQAETLDRLEARQRYEELEQNDRLRPVVVETRRGFDQMQQIREHLARLELTDGTTFARMLLEVAPRLPKDATLICVLPAVPLETSITLGMLRKQGFAISCLLIGLPDDGTDDRAVALGRLLAEGIRDTRYLDDEAALATLGDPGAARVPADYAFATTLA